MFETNFTTFDWWIVGVYLAGVGILGIVVNKYIHNVSDYMVGGRGSRTALNTATFIGTGLGLVTIMYAAMAGFNKGFSTMALGLIGVVCGLILGTTGFVVKRLRAMKLVTIPEFYERRYSKGVRVTAGTICAVAGILNMGLFPKMGATFITYVTGMGQEQTVATQTQVDPPAADSNGGEAKSATPAAAPEAMSAEMKINIITSLLIALVLVYTVLGGMVSVIVTDYVQFVILSVGLGLGLYFCLYNPDPQWQGVLGWGNIVDSLKEHRGESAFNPVHEGSYGWMYMLWMMLHVFAASLCWAPEASRVLTAKDSDTARRTFLVSMPGRFTRWAVPAFLAIAAFSMVTHSQQLTGYFFPDGLAGDAKNAGQAMPLLLGKIVPTGLLGLLVAGLMAAFMSTHDSYFLCWSSVIVRDVIEPLKRSSGSGLSDRQQISYARVIIVCIGLFLLVWGVWYPLPDSVWNYMAVTGSVYLCGAVVVLVGGFYWKRASSAGAYAALAGGLASAVIIFLPKHIQNNTYLMGIVGLSNYALCATLYVIFSLLIPDKPKPETVEASNDITPINGGNE